MRTEPAGRMGGRALVACYAGTFLISTSFPVTASGWRPAVPRAFGIADVLVAFLLLAQGFTIAAQAGPATEVAATEVTVRLLRTSASLLLALILIFFIAGDRVKWDVLLLGLAWRGWLFVWVLPAAVALWHRAR